MAGWNCIWLSAGSASGNFVKDYEFILYGMIVRHFLGYTVTMEIEHRDKSNPWELKTPPGTGEYTMHVEGELLVCQVGSTKLTYLVQCIEDSAAWLREQGDWVELGSADEQKEAKAGTFEAWGRSESNPVGGWYGQRKGYRGRFGMYVPPLLEALGLVELEHNPRNNRVRAR